MMITRCELGRNQVGTVVPSLHHDIVTMPSGRHGGVGMMDMLWGMMNTLVALYRPRPAFPPRRLSFPGGGNDRRRGGKAVLGR